MNLVLLTYVFSVGHLDLDVMRQHVLRDPRLLQQLENVRKRKLMEPFFFIIYKRDLIFFFFFFSL
jgi:hypothetical protein